MNEKIKVSRDKNGKIKKSVVQEEIQTFEDGTTLERVRKLENPSDEEMQKKSLTELEKSDDGDVTVMRSIILKDFSGKDPVEKVISV